MIHVLFFGKLRDEFNIDQLSICEPCPNIHSLFELLANKHDALTALKSTPNLLIAINQDMADEHATLTAGDEVAFFPPVTGG